MSYLSRLLLLALLATPSSHAIEMRIFSCKTDNLALWLLQNISDKESCLKVEANQKPMKVQTVTIEEVGPDLYVSSLVKGLGKISFRLTLPSNTLAEVNNQGMIDYREMTKSQLFVAQTDKESRIPMECRVFTLTNKFFDVLFSKFP